MNIRIILYIAGFILNSVSCGNYTLLKLEEATIKDIWVYNYFVPIGHTVGSAYRQFEELEKDSISKIKLYPKYVDSLRSAISNAKIENDYFGKLGGYILFATVTTTDNKILNIAITRDMIIDFTNQKNGYKYYFFKEKKSIEWQLNFIKNE